MGWIMWILVLGIPLLVILREILQKLPGKSGEFFRSRNGGLFVLFGIPVLLILGRVLWDMFLF